MAISFKPKVSSAVAIVDDEGPRASFIQKAIKGDTYMVMAASQLEPEDQFIGLYYTTTDTSKVMLAPPFDPSVLMNFLNVNNTLSQCVDVMENNVDGTGFEIVPVKEDVEVDEAEKELLNGFFSEPYPGLSYAAIRRRFRRELEAVGWALLEVLRSADNEVVAVRNILVQTIRMVKLDLPIEVQKTVMRGGKEVTITMWERERRFAQKIGTTIIYFREFGSTRHLNRRTGEWETPQQPVEIQDRATEVLYFMVNHDPWTPYGLPRWINNLPSVLGSRKAEEQNLEYFDAGGVPPSIVFVEGGVLGKNVSDQLRQYLTGQLKSKHRAVVVDVQSSSGSLDSAGSVRVKVERFGSEKIGDGMFQVYNEKCYEQVRTAFRLPPLFIGKAADYNFATAQVAYMVAEAQIFAPERMEFDDTVNGTLVKALGVKTCKLRSLPITMKDAKIQLEGLNLLAPTITKESLVQEVNKITGLTVEEGDLLEGATDAAQKALVTPPPPPMILPPGAKPPKPGSGFVEQPLPLQKSAPGFPAKKMESADPQQLLEFAQKYGTACGYVVSKFEQSEEESVAIKKQFEQLDEDSRIFVLDMVGAMTFGTVDKAHRSVFAEECGHAH